MSGFREKQALTGKVRRMDGAGNKGSKGAQVSFNLSTDPQAVRSRVEAMEKLLEGGFTVPGTNFRFGLDALLGLVPIAGDVISAGLGCYMLWEARNLGMSKWQITRMLGNVGFDAVLGLIPGPGDALDFVFRSNSRNLRIIKKHLDRHHPETGIIEQ